MSRSLIIYSPFFGEKICLFPLFSLLNFLFGGFLRFLGKSMVQNKQIITVKKTEQAKNIAAQPDSNLPYPIGSYQLFQKFTGYGFNGFYKIQNKRATENLTFQDLTPVL
jgi:hypothetical protein